MSFKRTVKQFVPPILWSMMALVAKGNSAKTPYVKRGLSEVTSGQNYSIAFHQTTLSTGDYFVPKYAEHRPASTAILSGDLYEPETHTVIAKILAERGGDLIHAGTFFGDMLPTFSRACSGIVYAFEPVLENYILAKLCLEANNLENVLLLNAALGSEISVAKIDTGSANETHRGGSSTISSEGQLTGQITIDCLGLANVTVIELDVEGHELYALQGARETIERSAPVILIEDNNGECDGFLGSLGYKQVKQIPGLSIWTRSDDIATLKKLI